MQIKCEEMIREMDNRIATIDLNGNHIIRDCKTMLIFLKEKLTELKGFVQTQPFGNDTDEIAFFKQYKPRILGPLFYFHHILRIGGSICFRSICRQCNHRTGVSIRNDKLCWIQTDVPAIQGYCSIAKLHQH